MSTVITPIVDQVPTVALWAAMVSAIDRGEADPLSSSSDTAHDSERLSYSYLSASGTTTGIASYQTIATVPVDQGMAFYHELTFGIVETPGGDGVPSDDLQLRITAPSGINVNGNYFIVKFEDPSISEASFFSVSGSSVSPTIRRGIGLEDVNGQSIFISMVILGNTASGNVTFEIVKNSDVSSDDYYATNIRSIGRRILG